MRPGGIGRPRPSPVEARRSRANRLSNTWLRAIPSRFSKSNPACSKSRFLLDTCKSMATWFAGSSLATRLILKTVSGLRILVLECCMRLLVELVLVAQDLAVELVRKQIDRGVQVLLFALAMKILAAHMERHFGFLAQLVHGEDDVCVDDVVEMPADALQLRAHITANRRRHVQMMAAHVQVHPRLLGEERRVKGSFAGSLRESAEIRGTSQSFVSRPRYPALPEFGKSGHRKGERGRPRRPRAA